MNTNYFTKIFIMFISISIIASCTKEYEKERVTEYQKFISVFIAGYESKQITTTNTDISEKTRAVYWYRNIKTELGVSTNNSKGLGVWGVGNYSGNGSVFDVYTCGYEEIGGVKKARLWKNTTQQGIEINVDAASVATAIFIANETDIYMAGYETNPNTQQTRAIFWVNGFKKYIDDEQTISSANAITVDNNILYIAGTQFNDSKTKAVYWKNQVVNYLPIVGEGTNNEVAFSQEAKAIVVKNSKVYVAGTASFGNPSTGAPTINNAVYWKNNLAIKITNFQSSANTIQVDDIDVTGYDNVYTAGYEYRNGNPTAAIWQNLSKLSFESSSVNSTIYSIFKTDKYFYKVGFHDSVKASSWSTDDTRKALPDLGFTSYANCVNVQIR